jgi:riboflavin synthase
MFTGIVEEVGLVLEAGSRLVVRATFEPQTGESIAVNGCCLTHVGGPNPAFDLSEETLRRTNLGMLRAGESVNLERALRVGDRLGGHLVAGHVDQVIRLLEAHRVGEGAEMVFEIPKGGEAFLVDKGSVCLDGISLTVVEPGSGRFRVAVVPHTLANTTMSQWVPGRMVNLEYDLVARYLQGLASPYFG